MASQRLRPESSRFPLPRWISLSITLSLCSSSSLVYFEISLSVHPHLSSLWRSLSIHIRILNIILYLESVSDRRDYCNLIQGTRWNAAYRWQVRDRRRGIQIRLESCLLDERTKGRRLRVFVVLKQELRSLWPGRVTRFTVWITKATGSLPGCKDTWRASITSLMIATNTSPEFAVKLSDNNFY